MDMALKIILLSALLATVRAGHLGGVHSYSGLDLGYANSYATPLAYSSGLYGSSHLSSYSSPIIAKTISASPLAYHAPLAPHYSAPLHYSAHLSSPIATKAFHSYSSPLLTKAIASPLSLHHGPSIYSKTIATPLAHGLGYGLGHDFGLHHQLALSHGYHGYASNYNW